MKGQHVLLPIRFLLCLIIINKTSHRHSFGLPSAYSYVRERGRERENEGENGNTHFYCMHIGLAHDGLAAWYRDGWFVLGKLAVMRCLPMLKPPMCIHYIRTGRVLLNSLAARSHRYAFSWHGTLCSVSTFSLPPHIIFSLSLTLTLTLILCLYRSLCLSLTGDFDFP